MKNKRGSQVRSFSLRARKKGASHLGFILSFVIFITFLLFVYSTLEPALKIRASKQPILDLLRFSLVDEFVIEDFTTMTIDITFDLDTSKECMKITGGEIHNIYSSGQELTIKDGEDNLLGYKDSGGNLVVSPLPVNNLLKIYYASELGKGSPDYTGGSGCGLNNIGQSEYDVGQIVEGQTKIFLSGISNLITQYETEYEPLKTELGIPDGSDFTFSFELASGTIIEPAGVTIPNTDVYATTFPVEYLDENADSKIGFMTIKVW